MACAFRRSVGNAPRFAESWDVARPVVDYSIAIIVSSIAELWSIREGARRRVVAVVTARVGVARGVSRPRPQMTVAIEIDR